MKNINLFESEIISLRKAGKSLKKISEWLKERNIEITTTGLYKWFKKRGIEPSVEKKLTKINDFEEKEEAVNLLNKFLAEAEKLLVNGKIKITADSILKAISLKLTGNLEDKGEQILLQIFQNMNMEQKKDATIRISEKLLERLQPIQDSIKSETGRDVNNSSDRGSEFSNSE